MPLSRAAAGALCCRLRRHAAGYAMLIFRAERRHDAAFRRFGFLELPMLFRVYSRAMILLLRRRALAIARRLLMPPLPARCQLIFAGFRRFRRHSQRQSITMLPFAAATR